MQGKAGRQLSFTLSPHWLQDCDIIHPAIILFLKNFFVEFCNVFWTIRLNTPKMVFCVFGHSKYGQVGCPWKDLAKCSSDLLSKGPPNQKLWPNLIFGLFPHCIYNVKLKSAGVFLYGSINLKLSVVPFTIFTIWQLSSKGHCKIQQTSFFWDTLLYTLLYYFL